MSIGRIEMIDGKKQYVRYATLGGGYKFQHVLRPDSGE